MNLEKVPHPFRAPLQSMYRGEPQIGADGQHHAIDTKVRVSEDQGLWLYQLCRDLRPSQTLEIGLAYAYSTLFILAALEENDLGAHTAVDPFQDAYWSGIGRTHAAQSPAATRFSHIQAMSVSALEALFLQGRMFEMIYIDGNHRFDDVLVDFTLAARICATGGVIVLDDMWMPSVKAAVSFITNNRSDFLALPSTHANIAAFKRIADDARPWSHFVAFQAGAAANPISKLATRLRGLSK